MMLQELGIWRGNRSSYERLNNGCVEKAAPMMRGRRLWMAKKVVQGRVKGGVRLSRGKKLNWKPFWVMFALSRKIAKMYGGFLKGVLKMDEACPAIVFSSQWGLPVLSHQSSVRTTRKSFHNFNTTWL